MEADLRAIQEIERRAGEMFRRIGMPAIADDEPPSIPMLRERLRPGMLWVATAGSDDLVGYLAAEVVDGTAHVLQVSVDPAHRGHRIGAALLNTLDRWAAARSLTHLTLTTFRDVPWNAPYYTRLGWSVLPEAELGPGLERIRRQEKESGLDRWPRVAMCRPVDVN